MIKQSSLPFLLGPALVVLVSTGSHGQGLPGALEVGAAVSDQAADPVAAADIAARLGRPPRFLVGMGNDLSNNHMQDGAYTLGVTLDLHYAYLVGLPGQGGWPDWNANGSFVNILTDSADANGVVPMFTLYQMAAWGEAQLSVLTNPGFMGPYWSGARLLFQRLAIFGKPAVVHLEPDFWAFAQVQNGNPAAIPVQVGAHAPECSDLPNNLTGMGRCLVRLSRTISPQVVIGFHASEWSGSPAATAAYLNAIGANEADIVVLETLDRDAGCFEAGVDPNCQRGGGGWYWDESNATSPNFHEHLAWAQAINAGVGRPLLWWQMPFGVPSAQPGGTAGHYRDNRVRYLFNHPDEFVAAGGVGAVFGVGAGNQTYITTDGGQFRNAVSAYFANPTPLPSAGTASLTVTSPNGGESWPTGSSQQIRWSATDLPASASVRVSRLNGAASTVIATVPQSDTSYTWTVSGAVTSSARVRVECVGCPTAVSDDSDGPFSIAPALALPVAKDLNGDGQADLLFREESTGTVFAWMMDGTSRSFGSFLTPSGAPTAWHVVGVGDLNGDGESDVLWREQTSGFLYAWLMEDLVQVGGGFLSPAAVPMSWKIAGLGDFNGDDAPDILWREQTSGALFVWYMNGLTQTGGEFLTPSTVPVSWVVKGVGDFNRDGQTDILWSEQATGGLYVWYMNGASQSGGSFLVPGSVPTSWQVESVLDLNDDGNLDLLWRQQASGHLYAWFMNGVTQTGGAFLSPELVPVNWHLEAR